MWWFYEIRNSNNAGCPTLRSEGWGIFSLNSLSFSQVGLVAAYARTPRRIESIWTDKSVCPTW